MHILWTKWTHGVSRASCLLLPLCLGHSALLFRTSSKGATPNQWRHHWRRSWPQESEAASNLRLEKEPWELETKMCGGWLGASCSLDRAAVIETTLPLLKSGDPGDQGADMWPFTFHTCSNMGDGVQLFEYLWVIARWLQQMQTSRHQANLTQMQGALPQFFGDEVSSVLWVSLWVTFDAFLPCPWRWAATKRVEILIPFLSHHLDCVAYPVP